MATLANEHHQAKISTTVDAELLDVVDLFIANHPDTSRRAVLDEAMGLWTARQREKALEQQLLAPLSPSEARESAEWKRIRSVAAARLFRQR